MNSEIKILIIDDELLIRHSLSKVAALRGFNFQTAATAKEGLKLWEAWRPHLVFLDLILPDQNGLAVISRVPKGAKVILMSAARYEETIKKQGVNLFIAKPFENIFETFDQAVSCLQKEAPLEQKNPLLEL